MPSPLQQLHGALGPDSGLVVVGGALRDRLLDDIAALFDAGFVSNWSECDGLCGHVIGPFVARHPHRRRVADEVSALCHSEFHDCTTRKVTVF